MIRRGTTVGPWITEFRTGSPRLVCLAHAGGSASAFNPLVAHLPAWLGVQGIRYPGRQDRLGEPCQTSIETMADEIFKALTGSSPDPESERPVLFGHSMGALVAFAVALRYQDAGLPPQHLFVSGCSDRPAPQGAMASGLDDEGFLAHVAALGGTDAAVLDCAPLVRLLLPAVRSDYQMYAAHRVDPQAVLESPITALVGQADPIVDSEQMLRWSARTTGGFRLRTFAGGHFYLNDNVVPLGRLIAATLEQGQR